MELVVSTPQRKARVVPDPSDILGKLYLHILKKLALRRIQGA